MCRLFPEQPVDSSIGRLFFFSPRPPEIVAPKVFASLCRGENEGESSQRSAEGSRDSTTSGRAKQILSILEIILSILQMLPIDTTAFSHCR